MASIKDLGGGRYRVFICNGFKADGKVNRTSKVITAKSLRDAEKQAQALEVDFKRGQQVQFAHAPTFNDLVEKWRELKKEKLEDKTQERDENFLRLMVPYFGNMKVRDIKAINIEAYLNMLKKEGVRLDGKSGGYSEKTIRHHYSFINSLLNLAVKWDIIEYNPCVKVDAPVVYKGDVKCYEEPDIKKLLDCLDAACEDTVNKFSRRYQQLYTPEEEYRRKQLRIFNDLMHKAYVWVALASACRRGELIGLTVENVDLENCRIVLTQTGHYSSTRGLYCVSHLKNGSPSKNVDMPVAVMELLGQYLQEREKLINLMGWEDSGFVFISLDNGNVTKAGGQMMPDVISTWFTRFLEKNGLPKITLHGVRHTSISYLINKGVDTAKVADRAGHQNTRTTEEIYKHIFAKTKRATADEYNDLFNGLSQK